MTSDLFCLIIGSLNQNIRLNHGNQLIWSLFIEKNDCRNKVQGCKDHSPGMFIGDWTPGAFQAPDRAIGVQADYQNITKISRFCQVFNMSQVQEIKTSVGEYNLSIFKTPDLTLIPDLRVVEYLGFNPFHSFHDQSC